MITRRLQIMALGAGVLCAIALGCGQRPEVSKAGEQPASTATPVSVSTVMRGPIRETLELTGSAQAAKQVDIRPEVSGRVSAIYGDVGDRVIRGQPLIALDRSLPSAQARQAQAAVGAAAAQLGQLQQTVKLTAAQTAIAIAQAQEGLQLAQQRLAQAERARALTRVQVENATIQARRGVERAAAQLRDIRAGSRRQEIASAEQALSQARAALQLAQSTLRRQKQLLEAGAIAQAQFDAAQTEVEVARARVKQAEAGLSLAQEGPRTEQVTLAELGLSQAQDALALAEKSGQQQLAIADKDVENARTGVAQARQALELAREGRRQVTVQQEGVRSARAGLRQAQAAAELSNVQVGKYTVYAPLSGLVALRTIEPGDLIGPGGDPVMRLVALDTIRVECTVSELDVRRLRVGQDAVVRVDGLGERQFTGRIADISPQAAKDQRNFIARVEVNNGDGAIKPGMFCRVSVVTGFRPSALLVHRDCIVEQAGKRLAYAVIDGKIAVREVALGAATDSVVEVTHGLDEGEMLVCSGQSMLADGQPVQAVERSNGRTPTPEQ